MAKVNIKKTDVISDNHYILKNIHFDVQKKDGSWESQTREVYDHGNAVTVLLYNKEKRTIILTEQLRIATFVNGNEKGTLIETCAGLLEENENPDDAVKREVEEETGYVIDQVTKIYEAYMSAGSLTEKIYYYIAPYTPQQKKSKGGGLEEEQEEINVLEISYDDALNMLDSGVIIDGKTIIMLQYLRTHLMN